MRRLCAALAICCLACGCLFTESARRSRRMQSQELLEDAEWEKTRALFQDLSKCAVTITPTGLSVLTSRGSGVVISSDGHVLTCAHVVELMLDLPAPGKASSVSGGEVVVGFFDGRSAGASLVAFDRKFDLALLKNSRDSVPRSAVLEPGVRVMPGDVVVALISEGEDEPVEHLMTAGKVIVPYSALAVTEKKSKYSSGLLFRAFGHVGMSGAPLFTRDGRFAGIVKTGGLGVYEDGTSFIGATRGDDVLRLLPDLMEGVSDRAYFTDAEFLAERRRQIGLQKRLAAETNPGFEDDAEYKIAVRVVGEQLTAARDALVEAGSAEKFAELMMLICVLDIYTARHMYAPGRGAEIDAFLDRD